VFEGENGFDGGGRWEWVGGGGGVDGRNGLSVTVGEVAL